MDVGESLSVAVTHDEVGIEFFGCPWRREAAGAYSLRHDARGQSLAPRHRDPNYSRDVLFFCTITRHPEAF